MNFGWIRRQITPWNRHFQLIYSHEVSLVDNDEQTHLDIPQLLSKEY